MIKESGHVKETTVIAGWLIEALNGILLFLELSAKFNKTQYHLLCTYDVFVLSFGVSLDSDPQHEMSRAIS